MNAYKPTTAYGRFAVRAGEASMYWTKEEIAEERDNLVKVLKAVRARRRILRLQAAQHGDLTPPQITMELATVAEKIKEYESELEQLEMRAAEGNLPLAEAEYRLLVAEMWDTERGHPNITGEARMEMARLRLGILPNRAQEIERNIRTSLAQDAMSKIDTRFLPGIHFGMKGEDEDKVERATDLIERAVFLEPDVTLLLFTDFLSKPLPPHYFNEVDTHSVAIIIGDIEYYLIKRRVTSDKISTLQDFMMKLRAFAKTICDNQRNLSLDNENKCRALKVLISLMHAYMMIGYADEAVWCCNDAISIIDQCTDKLVTMNFYDNVSRVYQKLGNNEKAEEYSQLQKQIYEKSKTN